MISCPALKNCTSCFFSFSFKLQLFIWCIMFQIKSVQQICKIFSKVDEFLREEEKMMHFLQAHIDFAKAALQQPAAELLLLLLCKWNFSSKKDSLVKAAWPTFHLKVLLYPLLVSVILFLNWLGTSFVKSVWLRSSFLGHLGYSGHLCLLRFYLIHSLSFHVHVTILSFYVLFLFLRIQEWILICWKPSMMFYWLH